ncbi:MAG: O-antigen ligase family protein [Mangrovibacterium sp.]
MNKVIGGNTTGYPAITVSMADVLVLLVCLLLFFHRDVPVDYLSLWKYGALFIVYLCTRAYLVQYRYLLLWGIGLFGLAESVVAVLQKACLLESRHSLFDVTGTFGNPGPLGGCLSVCFTACVGLACYHIAQRSYLIALFHGLASVIIFTGLLLSGSRAGWLAACMGFFAVVIAPGNRIKTFIRTMSLRSLLIKTGIILCAILLLTGVYLYKKDSADGRVLIWRVTAGMILDRPFFGHGTGGWTARYMYYQAAWFEKHPGSPYAMLADNAAYPYNEFLHIWVEQGILGLCLVLTLLYHVIFYRPDDKINRILKSALSAFAVFAFFSYPANVFLLALLLFFILGVIKSKPLFSCRVPQSFRYVFPALCIITAGLLSGMSYYFYRNALTEVRRLVLEKGVNDPAPVFFDSHYPLFRNNPVIMDAYAQYSFRNHTLERAEQVLRATAAIIPTCGLYCDMGEIAEKKGDFSGAQKYYQLAADMVPSRITPKYRLFELYVGQNDSIAACRIGKAILSQPVKVEGTHTLKMKAAVKEFLGHGNRDPGAVSTFSRKEPGD